MNVVTREKVCGEDNIVERNNVEIVVNIDCSLGVSTQLFMNVWSDNFMGATLYCKLAFFKHIRTCRH